MANETSRQAESAKLQQRIGHTFVHPDLLRRALTHSSLAYERAAEMQSDPPPAQTTAPMPNAWGPDSLADNEQLEFLGDAVLGLIAADLLYRRYPELREGELTRLRAALVSRRHLGQVALKLKLGDALFLGKGEERSGGRKKAALLANAAEALMAAIYLDSGFEVSRVFVEQWVVEPYVAELRAAIGSGDSIGDHKTALQQLFQARKAGQPRYFVKSESGPDHRKRFLVEVRASSSNANSIEAANFRVLARGSGSSKKQAEQEAARRACEKLVREEAQPEIAASSSANPAIETARLQSVRGGRSAEIEELVS